MLGDFLHKLLAHVLLKKIFKFPFSSLRKTFQDMPRGKTWREKGGEVAMSWEPPVAPSPSLSLSASSSFDCPQYADIIDV